METQLPQEKPVIHYRMFKSDKEFYEWQIDNNVNIFNISPIPESIKFDDSITENICTSGNITVSIFVTYSNK